MMYGMPEGIRVDWTGVDRYVLTGGDCKGSDGATERRDEGGVEMPP